PDSASIPAIWASGSFSAGDTFVAGMGFDLVAAPSLVGPVVYLALAPDVDERCDRYRGLRGRAVGKNPRTPRGRTHTQDVDAHGATVTDALASKYPDKPICILFQNVDIKLPIAGDSVALELAAVAPLIEVSARDAHGQVLQTIQVHAAKEPSLQTVELR